MLLYLLLSLLGTSEAATGSKASWQQLSTSSDQTLLRWAATAGRGNRREGVRQWGSWGFASAYRFHCECVSCNTCTHREVHEYSSSWEHIMHQLVSFNGQKKVLWETWSLIISSCSVIFSTADHGVNRNTFFLKNILKILLLLFFFILFIYLF